MRRRRTEWLVTLPTLVWLTLFIVIPTLLVFIIAFRPANPYGGLGDGWTLETVRSLWTPSYLAIAWRTLWISLLTTGLSLVLAIPAGYTIARASARWRNRLLLLVIVPFWTSFLVRVFAWKLALAMGKRVAARRRKAAHGDDRRNQPRAIERTVVDVSLTDEENAPRRDHASSQRHGLLRRRRG